MKGLILAGVCLVSLVVFCAAGLRIYRGDREYKVFLGSLLGAIILYTMLYWALPSDLGFLSGSEIEMNGVVNYSNGMLVLLLIFHGMWTFSYMVTGPTIRLLTELSAKRDQGLTADEAMLQFQREDLGNSFLRRRLPKLINGGYIATQNGAYLLLPRGRVAGGLVLLVKQAIGDIKKE